MLHLPMWPQRMVDSPIYRNNRDVLSLVSYNQLIKKVYDGLYHNLYLYKSINILFKILFQNKNISKSKCYTNNPLNVVVTFQKILLELQLTFKVFQFLWFSIFSHLLQSSFTFDKIV